MRKSKTMRKAIAAMLVLVMSLALAACGGNGSTPSSSPESSAPPDSPAAESPAANSPEASSPAAESPAAESPAEESPAAPPPEEFTSYTFAFNNWGSGAEVFDWHEEEVVYIMEDLLGMTLLTASDENTADGILRNVQNFIAADVDALLMSSAQPPVLPQIADLAMEAQIPFTLSIWVGTDEQRDDLVDNNPFFKGSYMADTYSEAYTLGKIAAANGHKTANLVGGPLGDPTIDTRVDGFTKAFVEEGGGEILDIARCSGPPESQEKASALLSANREADCMYVLVGDFFPGVYNAMQALDISPEDMVVYVSLCGTQSSEYIKDGVIRAATGGHDLSLHLAALALVNFMDGHPIFDENGKPPQFKVDPFVVDLSNVDPFLEIFFDMTDGQHVLTDDYMKSLLWRYNPDVTYQDFKNFFDNLSLEFLLGLHDR